LEKEHTKLSLKEFCANCCASLNTTILFLTSYNTYLTAPVHLLKSFFTSFYLLLLGLIRRIHKEVKKLNNKTQKSPKKQNKKSHQVPHPKAPNSLIKMSKWNIHFLKGNCANGQEVHEKMFNISNQQGNANKYLSKGKKDWLRYWTLFLGVTINTTIIEKCMAAPPKTNNRTIMLSNNPIPGFISKGNEVNIQKKYLHAKVYYGTFHDS
jgi:hypothetical protein